MPEENNNEHTRELKEKIDSLGSTVDWLYHVSNFYGGFIPVTNQNTEKRFVSTHKNITLYYSWQNSILPVLMNDIYDESVKDNISGVSMTQIVHRKRQFSNGLEASILEALNYSPALIHECRSFIRNSRGMGG